MTKAEIEIEIAEDLVSFLQEYYPMEETCCESPWCPNYKIGREIIT